MNDVEEAYRAAVDAMGTEKVSGLFSRAQIAVKLSAWQNYGGRAWFSEPRTGNRVRSTSACTSPNEIRSDSPLADGPPSPLGRAGQPATDRRGTARSAYQRQPRHTVWRRDLGSAHRTEAQPPLDPATTGKTEKRVLTPFQSSNNES